MRTLGGWGWIAGLLAVSSVHATSAWQLVADEGEAAVFVQPESVRPLGERVRVEVLVQHKQSRPAPQGGYTVEKLLSLYNCSTQEYLDLRAARYANRDSTEVLQLAEKLDTPDQYRAAKPGSLHGRVLSHVCGATAAR